MKISFAALACLIVSNVCGQSDRHRSFGVTLGTNLSHTSSFYGESQMPDSREVDNNKFGLIAGGFCKWNEAEKAFLLTEFNYTPKGSRPLSQGLEGPARIKLTYLALCQSIVYNLINSFGLFAGVETSFLVSGKTEFLDNNYDDRESVDLLQLWDQFGLDYQRVDLGLKAGMLFNPAGTNVSFSLGYTHGLTAVLALQLTETDEYGVVVRSQNQRIFLNRVLSLDIHYTFNNS